MCNAKKSMITFSQCGDCYQSRRQRQFLMILLWWAIFANKISPSKLLSNLQGGKQGDMLDYMTIQDNLNDWSSMNGALRDFFFLSVKIASMQKLSLDSDCGMERFSQSAVAPCHFLNLQQPNEVGLCPTGMYSLELNLLKWWLIKKAPAWLQIFGCSCQHQHCFTECGIRTTGKVSVLFVSRCTEFLVSHMCCSFPSFIQGFIVVVLIYPVVRSFSVFLYQNSFS